MDILVVDFGTTHLERLAEVCNKQQLTVVDGSAFDGLVDNALNGLIVIGDYAEAEPDHSSGYQAAIDLIRSGDMPVLGLGYGFELVCAALGADLSQLGDKDIGAGKLVPTEAGSKIFQGSDPILVAESLRWSVDEMPRGVAVLARSETGIEAVRSKNKPLFGLQQLPGDFIYPSDGKLVLENFVTAL